MGFLFPEPFVPLSGKLGAITLNQLGASLWAVSVLSHFSPRCVSWVSRVTIPWPLAVAVGRCLLND